MSSLSASDFYFQIGRQQIKFPYVDITVVANNRNVGNTTETVWEATPVGGRYIRPPVSAGAKPLTITSLSVNDTLLGSGAQRIQIEGINADYTAFVAAYDMNGSIGFTTPETYFRVNEIKVIQGGSCNGDITAVYDSGGANQSIIGFIKAGTTQIIESNITRQGMFTVPATPPGVFQPQLLFSKIGFSCGKDDEMEMSLLSYAPGSDVAESVTTVFLYQNSVDVVFDVPIQYPAGTDLEIVAVKTGAGGSGRCAAKLQSILRVD